MVPPRFDSGDRRNQNKSKTKNSLSMGTKKSIPVLTAIKRLSAVCDGAIEIDGQGFNKPDSGFFNSIAWVSCLTISEQQEYRERLLKYRHQLGVEELSVIDYGQPDEEIVIIQKKEIRAKVVRDIKKAVTVEDGIAKISFGYDEEMVYAVKQIPGKRFDWETKRWIIPVNPSNTKELKAFLEEYHFEFDEKMFAIPDVNKPTYCGEIKMKGNKIEILFPYNPSMVAMVKTIPGRRFDPNTKGWNAEVNKNTCAPIGKLLEAYNFSHPKELVLMLANLLVEREKEVIRMEENLVASSAMESDLEVPGFKGTMRPFQKAGVKYIVDNKKVIVGDEMGLGKTIEAIGAMEYTGGYPAMVACPNTLKYNWKRECDRFLDRKTIIINSDTDWSMLERNADIYVMNYNAMMKFKDILGAMKFRTLVSDESHFLKNNKAQRTKAFSHIVTECNPEVVMLLTGTVIVNRPNELLSPLTILDKLKEFGGFWRFVNTYCDAHRNEYGLDISGASNLDELHRKLRAICYIRRNKADVMPELPAKVRQTISLEIDNRTKYERAKNDVINYLRNEAEGDKKFYASLGDIENGMKADLHDFMGRFGISAIQFKGHELTKEAALKAYRELKAKRAETAEHLVKINELKKLVAEGKMAEAKSWIADVIESGEKLVVFCTHIKMVDELVKEFKCRKIDGSVSPEDRDSAVQDFQNNPDTKLIVLNLAAGKEGLTLTAASKLAFFELGWTPGEHDQAEDRIHRIGQLASVNIYYLIGHNTIDDEIFSLIETKREVTDAVNKGVNVDFKGEGILTELIERLLRA